MNAGMTFAFGPFQLIPERQLLLHGDAPVRIGGRALDLLTALVERPGELVGKRELIARAWPSTTVDDGNLKVNMAALRRALDDDAGAARYIATVTGRGYRFIAPVRTSGLARPAMPEAPGRTHNLPFAATRIFGRAEAIEAIGDDLERLRFVSIVGPGGVGKTTVGFAVAERMIEAAKDGVWLVDLSLSGDPALTARAIAAAIGATLHAPDMLATLADFLRDREMLILLDNCDHVVDAAATCASHILTHAAGVKILATSREPLLVKGERVRRLPGLAVPSPGARPDAAEAIRFPAVQLFVERATDKLETFRLGDAEAPAVAEICRRLDGLPLAIELAAARIDAFGVGGLLEQLGDRFRLLTGRRGDAERHRTLAATIDWSYNLLPENEAALLRAVSIFAGIFDIDDALAVQDAAPAQAVEGLAQLAAKSLLAIEVDASGIAYRLLETTRAYCLDRLHMDAGAERAVRRRHAAHVCAVLERAEGELGALARREWGAAYGRFLDDLRNALDWAGRDAACRSLRIRLTVAGLLLWNHFSLTEECRMHVSRAVDDLDAAGLAGSALEMKLKVWLGNVTMLTRGFHPSAIEAARGALEIAVRIDDSDYRLRCLMMIGIHELFTGELEAGMRTLGAFAALAAAKDPSNLPESEVHLGVGELFLGRLEDVRRRFERLQQRDLRSVDSYGVRYLADLFTLVGSALSQIQWLTGSPDTARRSAASAVELAGQTGHHLSMINALSYACASSYWSGDREACGRYVAMLGEKATQHGIFGRRPVATFYRAALGADDGGPVDRVGGLRQAIGEFREVNHLVRMPYYLGVLADALLARGDLGEADATIRQALDIAYAKKEGWCLPEVLRVRAAVLTAAGRMDDAEGLLVEAMATAGKMGALSWWLRAATDLARLWSATSGAGKARALLLPVYNRFNEGFGTPDLVAAARILELPPHAG
jgi:predicted ATPase/DNA-binding winged helix-turn-helix (wHTH) protein